jgi:lauroyl/myristoyl acyltransferase
MRQEVLQVCGELDEGRVEAILEETQEIISCDEMDPYLFLRLGRRGSDRVIALEGLHHLETATRRGGGAILFSAHFGGGYAFLVALGSRGYRPCPIFAQIDRMPMAQRLVLRVRVALMKWTSNGESLFTGRASLGHEILARLSEGNPIVVLLDARPESHAKRAIQVEFLGRQCRLSYGVLDLVATSGAPLLPFFVYYTGPHLRRAVIGKPVEFVTDPDPLVARKINLRRCLERIEEAVSLAPSHWMLWGHFEGLWSDGAEAVEALTASHGSSVQDLRR